MEGRYARSPFFALVRYELRSLARMGVVFMVVYGTLLASSALVSKDWFDLAFLLVSVPLPMWAAATSMLIDERRTGRAVTVSQLPIDPRTRWRAKATVTLIIAFIHAVGVLSVIPGHVLFLDPNVRYLEELLGFVRYILFNLWLPAGSVILAVSPLTNQPVLAVLVGMLVALNELILRYWILAKLEPREAHHAVLVVSTACIFCILSRAAFLWREDPHSPLAAFQDVFRREGFGTALSRRLRADQPAMRGPRTVHP